MDEAWRVIDRLQRIEALRLEGASPRELLAQLRQLVHEGEAWIAVEGRGTRAAGRALANLDSRLRRASDEPTDVGRREVAPTIGR